MPRRPRGRRSRSRRTLPPRPPSVGLPPAVAAASGQPRARRGAASERPARLVERDAPFLIAELRRIALVSAACLGLLLMLVAVDRLG